MQLDPNTKPGYPTGMDIRFITPDYAVSPQIVPSDLPAIAAAGFTTVLCNRPDYEIPMEVQADAIRIATEAAGLTFIELALTHDTLEQLTDKQMDILAQSDGPVFAYCASGTRCSIIWSLGQCSSVSTDDVINAAAKAGYDLEALRPRLANRPARR